MATESSELGVVDALVQLSFGVQSVLAKAAARHDLTIPQIRLLGILRDREPGMLQLARHLGLDKSSVTGLIDRAARRGLVQRTPIAEDGRAIRVSSTRLGRQLTEKVSVDIAAQIGALCSTLEPPEQRVLGSLISRLIAGQMDPSGPPTQGDTVASGQQ